jgi:F-type H+-transporting ATPase subunit gamma
MATLTDLRKRLRGVQTICQLAGAMRTVSSAKLNQLNAVTARFIPYAQGCRELLAASGAVLPPAGGGDGKTLVILLSGNRGLCGSYHNELFAYFRSLLEPEGQLYLPCGKMAAAWCRDKGIPVLEEMAVPDVPEFSQAETLADKALELYASGEVSRVLFVYGEAVNALRQEPRCVELLPGEGSGEASEALWIPDLPTAQAGLLEFCLRAQVFSLLLKGAQGVQGATLVSMRSAYDNGKKSAAALETAINRLRQTQVTAGVIETSSGYGTREEG